MADFTREIRITPSWDYRDDPADQRGAHGCDLFFILRGDLGAMTARIMTGWVARPLTGAYEHGKGPQDRRGRPGVDPGVTGVYPVGVGTYAHSLQRRQSSVSRDKCDVLPGGTCWCTGGLLVTDELVKTLATMGSDGVWHQLEDWYGSWIEQDPVAEEARNDG